MDPINISSNPDKILEHDENSITVKIVAAIIAHVFTFLDFIIITLLHKIFIA